MIPVLTIDDPRSAVDLALALIDGGLNVIEVTLRTPAAFQAIEAMAQIDGAIVGCGTLITPEQVTKSVDAGAQFGVSPGSTLELFDACENAGLAFLPGVDNVTTAMNNLARGYAYQKFFPAELSGGVPKVAALGVPLPDIVFCPTGGVSADNVVDYLQLPNVCCVGGSWVAPMAQIASRQWQTIQQTAAKLSSLRRSIPPTN